MARWDRYRERDRPWLLLALVLLIPGVAAHGSPSGSYDPLSLEWHAFFTASGTIEGTAPPAGTIVFPPSPLPPGSPPPPLRFAFASPVAFEPGGGFDVSLVLRVDAPLVAQGEALEIALVPGGDPVRVALPGGPVIAPGTVVELEATLQAPGALYEQGAAMEVVLQPLFPALAEGALSLVVGDAPGSRFDAIDMRVPSPADLKLQDVPHTEIVLGADVFEPPSTHAVNTFVVAHDRVTPPAAGAWSDAGTYVVLRGEEPQEDARDHALADEDARRAAAHEFRVNGVVARVHPGLAVIVRVTSSPISVLSQPSFPPAEDPATPFLWTYARPPVLVTADPGVLVPPPPDASGIPVSEDEPPTKDTPFPPATAAIAVAFAVAFAFGGSKR